MRERSVVLFIVVFGVLLGVGGRAGAATGGPAYPLQEHDAAIVVESATAPVIDGELYQAMQLHAAELSAAPAGDDLGLPAGYGASVSGISVTYLSSEPAPTSVRAVIDAAVAQWNQVLSTDPAGPIVIEVAWSSLNHSSLLGYAGPDAMYSGGGLPTSSLYPAALTNTLLALDANGPSRPEINVTLNSDLLSNGRWYLETTGEPAWNQVDLYSVVLHEIGHGLGFLGSAAVHSGHSEPTLSDPLYIYDTVASSGGTPINEVGNQGQALMSGDVHIQISSESSYEVYAPSSWSQGSSFSHFDEHAYPAGSAGALMTPQLASGETARVLDAAVLGLMAKTGWPMTVKATTPSIVSLSPSLTSVVVDWEQNLSVMGLAPDIYTVQAWRDDSSLQSSTTVSGSQTVATVGSLSPGQSYTIKVVPISGTGPGTAAVSVVQLSSSGGPADPADWPTYIRDLPLDGQINRLYQAYFLRLADESGFGYWVDQRARWTSLQDISGAFASSVEFQNRYGALSNEAFVDLVYANVLNRPGDAEGRQYWLAQLNGGLSRGELMVGFAEGAEFISRTGTEQATGSGQAKISRLYAAFFLRAADAEGLEYWTAQIDSGAALDAVSSAFAQSAEFQSRYGSMSDQQFIELVYQNVLGREADAEGRQYWTSLLETGLSRGSAMVGFSESIEFIKSTGTIP